LPPSRPRRHPPTPRPFLPPQSNSTVKYFKGQFQDPTTFFQVPLLNAVARESARAALSRDAPEAAVGFRWAPRLLAFPHPFLQSKSLLGGVLAAFIFAALMFSFVAQVGAGAGARELSGSRTASARGRAGRQPPPPQRSWTDRLRRVACQLCFAWVPRAPPSSGRHTPPHTPRHRPVPAPAQMTNLVAEREAGLRTALRNMGMLDSSYWASWMAFDAVMGLLGSALILAFGEEQRGPAAAAAAAAARRWGGMSARGMEG
jgi:hypothetical protein